MTPHETRFSGRRYTEEQAQANFAQLKAAAKAVLPDLRLYLGREMYWADSSLLSRLSPAVTMANTEFVLVEFDCSPYSSLRAQEICDALARVAETGWKPILAHPKRYVGFTAYREQYRALREQGGPFSN